MKKCFIFRTEENEMLEEFYLNIETVTFVHLYHETAKIITYTSIGTDSNNYVNFRFNPLVNNFQVVLLQI